MTGLWGRNGNVLKLMGGIVGRLLIQFGTDGEGLESETSPATGCSV